MKTKPQSGLITGRVVGQPLDRVDGRLKVTGAATYSAEYFPEQPVVHGFIVQASIGKGTIVSIDASEAEAMEGVLLVMTHENAPKQAKPESGKTVPMLHGTDVLHHGQPVALVVATSFEIARDAASRVVVQYQEAAGRFELEPEIDSGHARTPKPLMNPPDSSVGDFEGEFDKSPVQVDARYTTPHQVHIQMEPHASVAEWSGDTLTLHTANQLLADAVKVIAKTLQVDADDVRVISRYIGGGFGSKLEVYADAMMAALAARVLKRPVKVVLTRQQIFHVCSHRSQTLQRVRLGADAAGRLQAIAHEVWSENLPGESFYESAADQTRSLYAAEHRLTTHRLVELDLPIAASMRAPGEAVGLLALECAMDELAERLKMDPIELRILNEPTEDPEKHVPYSSRHLVECLKTGAERFGWNQRHAQPGSVRDGRWQVGIGMASAIRANMLQPSKATVKLGPDGRLIVRTAMTDIGTGTYTILTQIAAELMGLPCDRVTVEMGDTSFPPASGSGGSWGAGSSGSSVYQACTILRQALAEIAGVDHEAATFDQGALIADGQRFELADLAGAEGIEATGEIKPGDEKKKFAQYSFGAHFAEVGVDLDSGEVRLRRMLGVFTAGRILNPKTARSQAIGGMTFGVGAALTEEALVDARFGSFTNHDMAEYHVPVHADIPAIDAIYLDELDAHANPLQSKGVGELGVCGAGAAVANAVYNACGVRLRDYPLTLDKILAGRALQ